MKTLTWTWDDYSGGTRSIGRCGGVSMTLARPVGFKKYGRRFFGLHVLGSHHTIDLADMHSAKAAAEKIAERKIRQIAALVRETTTP
jgi:hypothetical protein